MTTLKELFDQLNIPVNQRYYPKDPSFDFGDYTFTDMNKPNPFVWEFTNKDNPNILLMLNEEKDNIVLFKLNDDGTVTGTNWIYGEIKTRTFEDGYPFKKRNINK